MSINLIRDYTESGFRTFALWGLSQGQCECGDDKCEALGKHPRVSNWQHSPVWSEDQLEIMLQFTITTGFGVCLDNHLVLDIDPRNGGNESYERLVKDTGLDYASISGFVVATGGGGKHIYFSRPEGAYLTHLSGYPGIDFKTSGYVVGAGSLHKLGADYEVESGSPCDLTDAPEPLLNMLKRTTHTRASIGGNQVDVSAQELQEIVRHIPDPDSYDNWVAVGMGIHHATQGAGFHIWDAWSQQSSKYDPEQMGRKWHSFGKSANPVTLGTLIFKAEQDGYVVPVTFQIDSAPAPITDSPDLLPFDDTGFDLKRPPGLVGQIVEWMNGNAYDEPLGNLTVISSLTAVGNIVGLHMTDHMNVSTNLLSLCIAESATGKESVGQSYAAVMRSAGMGPALHGSIKSKQEIGRNLIEHQMAAYVVDEMGEVLRTIENAKKRGGAAYLEGVTGDIMSISTKAGGSYAVSGDVRRELLAEMRREMSQCQKAVDAGEDSNGRYQRRLDALTHQADNIATNGLVRPFLSLIGYSVPASMDCIMTEEMAKNGFLSRAIMAIEENDNPRPRINSKGMQPVPERLEYAIKALASHGNYDPDTHRIEYYGERYVVPSTAEAAALLNDLRNWQHAYAEYHRETTGFTPLIRRFFEAVAKISLILAAPERLRTVNHVQWAAAYVKRDLDRKIRHVMASMAKESKDGEVVRDGLSARIYNICQGDNGETLGVILKKCKRKDVTPEQIVAILDAMASAGQLSVEIEKSRNGSETKRYYSV